METIKKNRYVFQVDSEIVNKVYKEDDNYIIEYSKINNKSYCAIYFSSNDIYYPNNEIIFKKRIIERNFYEWYNTRIEKAYKHIFIRDIFKQWYLDGISSKINTHEKLYDFLKRETDGFNIITIGSSAGGYAAILYGGMLNAEKIIAFNPQFELKSLLLSTSEIINPLIFKYKETKKDLFDLKDITLNNTKIFYFISTMSQWDNEQSLYIGKKKNLFRIKFTTSHHGIPFLKVALSKVINLKTEELIRYTKNNHNPIFFTMKIVGIRKTIDGIIKQIIKSHAKRK